MDMPDPNNWHFPIEWLYALLAATGGGARYLNMYLNSGKFLWTNFIANLFISGFSGLMFAFMAESMNMPPMVLYIFAGVGGFMGHNALEFLASYLKTRISFSTE